MKLIFKLTRIIIINKYLLIFNFHLNFKYVNMFFLSNFIYNLFIYKCKFNEKFKIKIFLYIFKLLIMNRKNLFIVMFTESQNQIL